MLVAGGQKGGSGRLAESFGGGLHDFCRSKKQNYPFRPCFTIVFLSPLYPTSVSKVSRLRREKGGSPSFSLQIHFSASKRADEFGAWTNKNSFGHFRGLSRGRPEALKEAFSEASGGSSSAVSGGGGLWPRFRPHPGKRATEPWQTERRKNRACSWRAGRSQRRQRPLLVGRDGCFLHSLYTTYPGCLAPSHNRSRLMQKVSG